MSIRVLFICWSNIPILDPVFLLHSPLKAVMVLFSFCFLFCLPPVSTTLHISIIYLFIYYYLCKLQRTAHSRRTHILFSSITHFIQVLQHRTHSRANMNPLNRDEDGDIKKNIKISSINSEQHEHQVRLQRHRYTYAFGQFGWRVWVCF